VVQGPGGGDGRAALTSRELGLAERLLGVVVFAVLAALIGLVVLALSGSPVSLDRIVPFAIVGAGAGAGVVFGIVRPTGRTIVLAGFAVGVFIIAVVVLSWAGNAITLDSIVLFLVVGVTIGSIYAVAAAGLVVTYTTSGIFNFSQGAIGMFMAFVYWELKVNLGIQTLVALGLTVLVGAPLLGAAIEVLVMRRLADSPLVAQLVATIGLMVFGIGAAGLLWNPDQPRDAGTFFGTDGFDVGTTHVPWFRVITIVSGLAIALLLRFVLYNTRLGIGMRAVVDDRQLVGLTGAKPGRMSMVSWAIGASMAALAGIFLAEEFSALSAQNLTLFIVDAFAAAIIGRLRSLPWTYVGGILIGLAISFQENFLSWSGRWSTASTAIPTIILFLALLFLPQARIEGRRSFREITPRVPRIRVSAYGMAALFVVVVLACAALGRTDVRHVALALGAAFIMLSLVPLTGWSGQISLAQITFAGVGAYAFAELAPHVGSIGGLMLAALCAVPFGVLMALPALRLQGLYLALASMAFARMAEFVFFDQPEVFGPGAKRLGSLKILGFDFSKSFTIFGVHFGEDVGTTFAIAALFGVVGVLIVCLRRGAFGRRLVAMRDSPAACATFGVNLTTTKIFVFALSAGIAGFAGALYGLVLGSAGTMDFQMLAGLPIVLLVVVGGVAVVSGSLLGGFLLQTLSWLNELFPTFAVHLFSAKLRLLVWNERLGPGLLAIGISRQPEGIIPKVGADVRARRAPPPPTAPSPPPEAAKRDAVPTPIT
jgi:branched-chain amino acid transport system permease protein